MVLVEYPTEDRRLRVESLFSSYGDNYRKERSESVMTNAVNLVKRVNGLLDDLGWKDSIVVSSGWRPESINRAIGGAKNSYHTKGMAVDISDPYKRLAKAILERVDLLDKYELWMENPEKTSNWVHMDIGARGLVVNGVKRTRVFNP